MLQLVLVMPEQTLSNRKRTLFTWILNVGLVGVLIGTLELLSGVYASQPLGQFQASWRFNHTLIPNSAVMIDRYGKSDPDWAEPYPLRVNSLGWREEYEVERTKPADVFRVFYMGDSFIQGSVPDELAIPTQVETALAGRSDGSRYEVINAGVSSYSPILYYLSLRYRIAEYDPDLVVINVDMTDDFDDWKYRHTLILDENGDPAAAPPRNVMGADFIDTAAGAVEATWSTRLKLFLFQHSNLFRYLSYLDADKEMAKIVTPKTPDEAAKIYQRWAWCRDEWDPFTETVTEDMFDILRRTARFCRERGIRLALSAVPHYGQYAGDTDGSLPPKWSARPHHALEELANELGVPYLNAYKALRPQVEGTPQSVYYYRGDMHFNPRGYEIWADAHIEWIQDVVGTETVSAVH